MIVDANVLIYAVDKTSHFHAEAKGWLEDALNGPSRVGLPWVSLTAFQRIVTHPRASDSPLTPEDGWRHVSDWLNTEQAWIAAPGLRHAEILGGLITDNQLRGNLVTDAHIAAIALEHGVGVVSFDGDFARFAELNWVNPARDG